MTGIADHYARLYAQHGDDPRAVQLADRVTQRRRFNVLLDVAPGYVKSSIMDVGCGLGHLGEYLQERSIEAEYSGVDLTPEFVAACRTKFPGKRFDQHDISRAPPPWTAHYLVLNGVFNNVREGAEEFVHASLRNMYASCEVAIAFNAMSTYVDFRAPDLVYMDPEEIFAFCKTELSPRVTLRHDYQVRTGVLPFEFTVYVHRSDTPPRPKLQPK